MTSRRGDGFVADVRARFEKEMRDIERRAASGVSDQVEYQRLVGRYKGLRAGLDMVTETVKLYLTEEEDTQ